MLIREHQNIEWKESWRDEYLEWICGFANAQGGKIFIGVDDNGNVVGVSNAKRLLEDIPNKIVNRLGIVADVNLLSENDKEYIEITVTPYQYPVTYRGKYHYRTGSTKQILQGNALTQFLLKKLGTTWDNISQDSPKFSELRHDSFDIFREEAVRNRRMKDEDLDTDNELLLRDLNLVDEAGNLKRAAVLLFHHKPERWFPNSYIKIAYFESESEIKYQDEVHGSLMQQATTVIDLLYMKYLKALISYDGDIRVDEYPYPREAIREAVYNAIAHKNYASFIPIQIKVFDDKLFIANECIFPDGWTVDTLFQKHESRPQNPLIANAFYRAGFIESWGRGIKKITDACKSYGINNPKYSILPSSVTVEFDSNITQEIAQEITQEITQENLSKKQKEILGLIESDPNITREALAKRTGFSPDSVKYNLDVLKKKGILSREGSTKNGKWVIQ